MMSALLVLTLWPLESWSCLIQLQLKHQLSGPTLRPPLSCCRVLGQSQGEATQGTGYEGTS